MGKHIVCREVGFDCDGEIHAATEDEALASAAAHVKSAHGIDDVTPDMLDKVISVMRDEPNVASAHG
jgi:predicted small metal-binding protein